MTASPPIPHGTRLRCKLLTAVLALSSFMVAGMALEFRGHGWAMRLVLVGPFSVGLWMVYLGVYRSASLQRLCGWGAMVGSLLITWILLQRVWHGESISRQGGISGLFVWAAFWVTAYLLVIDREVARFRAELRQYERAINDVPVPD